MKWGQTNSRSDKGGVWRILLVFFPCLWCAGVSFPQTAQSYRQEATELARAKSWDEAIAAYRKSLELEPKDSLTHYDLALALKYKGAARQAADEFESALRLKPKWADAHYGLGATWFDLHEQAAALKELRTAVALDPANAGARRLLARIYSEQNNPSGAEAELRKALQAKPSADLYFDLGLTEGQLGNLQAAAEEFRRALRMNQGFAPAHIALGV